MTEYLGTTESYDTNAKQIARDEVNRICWLRIGEFWGYCGALLLVLTAGGYAVMGTLRILFPLTAICLFGGITATLFALSHRANANRELQQLLGLSEHDSRPPDLILQEIEELESYSIPSISSATSFSLLNRRIFR